MNPVDHVELRTSCVTSFDLKAATVIRVTAGRLWLTVQGQPEDVWLHAGQAWTMPFDGRAHLSAEPHADVTIDRRQSRCAGPMVA